MGCFDVATEEIEIYEFESCLSVVGLPLVQTHVVIVPHLRHDLETELAFTPNAAATPFGVH